MIFLHEKKYFPQKKCLEHALEPFKYVNKMYMNKIRYYTYINGSVFVDFFITWREKNASIQIKRYTNRI